MITHEIDRLPTVGMLPLEAYAEKVKGPLHRNNVYAIVWVKDGCGHLQIDFTDYEVENNTLYLLSPGQLHRVSYLEGEGYVLYFTEDFFSLNETYHRILYHTHVFFCFGNQLSLPVAGRLADTLPAFVYQLGEELTPPTVNRDIVRALLQVVILQIDRAKTEFLRQRSCTFDFSAKRLFTLAGLLERNFRTHHSADFYAEQLHITPKRLNEITRELVGKTVTQLLHDRMILEAKRHLIGTEKSVKEIAVQLGFADYSYFSRFFRKQTSVTPQAFRQRAFR